MTVLRHPIASARQSSANDDNHSAHGRDSFLMVVEERWSLTLPPERYPLVC